MAFRKILTLYSSGSSGPRSFWSGRKYDTARRI